MRTHLTRSTKLRATGLAVVAIGASAAMVLAGSGGASVASSEAAGPAARTLATKAVTPIKHVVVIFDENVSYDHYFGTYPKATNKGGTHFKAKGKVPKNDNLRTAGLLKHNPNLYKPARLGPKQAPTCDQNHGYKAEQQAYNNRKMNKFVQHTNNDVCTGLFKRPGLGMDYYDGNTVTALWKYANRFALSDRTFGSTFGPSTPGAINLISGQTHGFIPTDPTTGAAVGGVGTLISDPDPAYDDCSNANHTRSTAVSAAREGQKNIGDLLNAGRVTWGWFQGGFRPTAAASTTRRYAVCGAHHKNVGGAQVTDYSPHHNPFSYYRSTANPHHLAPSSVKAIGRTDRANHNYDLRDFSAALKAGHLPAVSFLKASAYQDGHAGYSDPIDEQHFLVKYVNAIQRSKFWKSTAIVITYDDSDGWYDHVASPILNSSNDPVNDTTMCSGSTAPALGGFQDRCGPGPRLPLLVLSPYAKRNFVYHKALEQTSVTRFIENNWKLGRIGGASFDARARSLNAMFHFKHADTRKVILRPNGRTK